MDTGRVYEYELTARQVLDRDDSIPRRLRLVRNDRDLRADHAIEERGLAGIRTANERGEASTGHGSF